MVTLLYSPREGRSQTKLVKASEVQQGWMFLSFFFESPDDELSIYNDELVLKTKDEKK